MPKSLKLEASDKLRKFIDNNKESNGLLHRLGNEAVNFANEQDTCADNRNTFLQYTQSMDSIRNENFWQIFPELNNLATLKE